MCGIRGLHWYPLPKQSHTRFPYPDKTPPVCFPFPPDPAVQRPFCQPPQEPHSSKQYSQPQPRNRQRIPKPVLPCRPLPREDYKTWADLHGSPRIRCTCRIPQTFLFLWPGYKYFLPFLRIFPNHKPPDPQGSVQKIPSFHRGLPGRTAHARESILSLPFHRSACRQSSTPLFSWATLIPILHTLARPESRPDPAPESLPVPQRSDV